MVNKLHTTAHGIELTLHMSALYTGALGVQGASMTSMHFRVLVYTLRTMVHAHAHECKVKIELYHTLQKTAYKISAPIAINRISPHETC